jgi:DNA-binding IclR family transcriptional regulator
MKNARTTTGKYVVDAVAKALDVLGCFNGSEGLSLNEISRRVGLNKSRTFRLLCTLRERGYIERNADGTLYRLGMKLFERASNLHRDLRDVARDFMLDLSHSFNETVNLGILDGGHVLYLDIVEASRPFRMGATVGCRMPAHQTSMGKALCAYMGANSPGSPLATAVGGLSKKGAQQFQHELELVQRRGYAIDDEENEPGVGCIGAPIFNALGIPIAAISVSGPVRRIVQHEKSMAAAVVAACAGVSKRLGYEPQREPEVPRSGNGRSRWEGWQSDRVSG